MDYDHKQILPEDYQNREERPKRRREFDRPAIDRERTHQWRDDSQTEPSSTAKR